MDNTPEPEPEDVQAHLIGGVPETEVESLSPEFEKFGVSPDLLFEPERPGYLAFRAEIGQRSDIRDAVEADEHLRAKVDEHHAALESWWTVASEDFAQLRESRNGGKKMPDVRQELLSSLKERLVPLGVLDVFKSAGVFVNWWQQIRFDLKTIVSLGWHHTLIPDDYLIAEFFQAEADAIETVEARIAELQADLAEAVETAQEVASYEPDEDEKVTATSIKKALKELIEDLKDTKGESGKRELKALKQQDHAIKALEKAIKEAKADLKEKMSDLEQRLLLKRLGGEEFTAETKALIEQVDARLADLDPEDKSDKRKINALTKDRDTLEARLIRTAQMLGDIGGQLTEEQARELILRKIYDIANAELNRYLAAENRSLIYAIDNLYRKYAVSNCELENARSASLQSLSGFLSSLEYVP